MRFLSVLSSRYLDTFRTLIEWARVVNRDVTAINQNKSQSLALVYLLDKADLLFCMFGGNDIRRIRQFGRHFSQFIFAIYFGLKVICSILLPLPFSLIDEIHVCLMNR